jgi:hypothetical protein
VRLATRQQGVFALAQMRALGLTTTAVNKRCAGGHLYRIHHGVYALVPARLLSLRGRYTAAVLACGPGAVLSHRSAAALHDVRLTERSRIEVTVPRRSGQKHPGLQIHRSTTLTSDDVTTVDGIPVTTVARTAADLAEVLPERSVERALERAAILEILDGRAVQDQITRHPRGACLRRLTADPIAPPTESELEERFLALCRSSGLPEPERQVNLAPDDSGPMVRADFLWRPQRLVVETDGARFHGPHRSFESDRRRDQRLTAAGWRVIRVTWRQIVERPHEVVALLRQLLAG